MDNYQIIDEPKVRFLEKFIVHPVIILFAAMLVPMFVVIPFYGRFWIPFVWLILNGISLGSPTIKKEIVYAILGIASLIGLYYLGGYFYVSLGNTKISVISYLRILMSGVFFLFLYLIVFLQEAPYQIYQYIKEKE